MRYIGRCAAGMPTAQQSHDDRIRALAAHLRAFEEAEWSRRDIPQAGSLGIELRSRATEARRSRWLSARHIPRAGSRRRYYRACNGTVPGGRTLRAGPLKDVRSMEWRRWCAVVRRQWCEARRCYMAPPRAAASSKLTNGRVPVEAGREPTHVQHAPQYHMATGKRKRRTLTCGELDPRHIRAPSTSQACSTQPGMHVSE